MHFVAGDVGRKEDVDRLFAEAERRAGKVDILVNNAAAYPKVAFLDSSHEDWTRAIETNLIGLAYCCRRALPGMLERGYGRIINVGTLAWRSPIPASSAYAASKAAVRVLTVALAGEIDRARYPDVLVNELLPGIIRTRMSDDGQDPASVYAYARNLASLPRNGPTGTTFLQGDVYVENQGLRAKLGRLLRRMTGR
jgi:3-oxoacyl-[acyl-carrier protein] reductase